MTSELPGPHSAPLAAALELLADSGKRLDLVELLDVLWLAGRLTGGDTELPLARAAGGAGPAAEVGRFGGPSGTQPDEPVDEDPDDAFDPGGPLHGGSRLAAGQQGSAGSGQPVLLPAFKALPGELGLARALRPLKRHRRSRHEHELDVEATIARFAETGLLEPVLRAGRERWLRCSLVVDDGLSMLLWQRTVAEFQLLVERSGAFQQVTVNGLGTRGPDPVRLSAKPFGAGSASSSPAVLADPSGQSLVLVMTDGVGAAWRDGRMRAALDGWGRCGPVAVVQLLPRRMWAGTGLAVAQQRVYTTVAGGPNAGWRRESADVPVPVLELVPASLTDWARTVAGPGGSSRLPCWESPPPAGAVERSAGRDPGAVAPPAAPQPEELLARFRSVASPEARRLAARLAAVAPFTVPVMRLVQADLRSGGGPAALAEVFLSGLLEPVPWSAEVLAAPTRRQQLFDFPPVVRDRLFDSVPTRELLEAGRRLVRRLAGPTGRGPGTAALLAGPAQPGGPPVQGEPFAWASAALIARLGGGGAQPAAGGQLSGAERSWPEEVRAGVLHLPSALGHLGWLPDALPQQEAAASPELIDLVNRLLAVRTESPNAIRTALRLLVRIAELTDRQTLAGRYRSDLLSLNPRAQVAVREPQRAGNDRGGGVAKPHFFVSYAHMPPVGSRNPNLRVTQFYEDLCEAVGQLSPLPTADPVGFMDDSMHQGDSWAARVSEALATCRVFVPLYHPRLFRSVSCGQEWYTFAQRSAGAPGGPALASAIVPVLWVGMRDEAIPPVASAIQYKHSSFPQEYVEDGLYALMAQRHHQEKYEQVVYRLARRIVDVAVETVVPVVEPLDFSLSPSAFPTGSPADQLTIAVLSLKRSELPPDRDPAYYGAGRTDWQPYERGSSTALAERAAQLARQCDLNPTIQEFDAAAGRLLELEQPGGPGVVLLDRWALADPERRELVSDFVRRAPSWVTVVEPWNRDDPQSAAYTSTLSAFSHQMLGRAALPSFGSSESAGPDAAGIPTAREFGAAFQHAALRAQKAFKERGLPRPSSGIDFRPRLRDFVRRSDADPDKE
ncbi:FxsC-like protein [Kitasatospora sp. MAA4]|uniref:TIR-like protein FxsC n=1 Tax=Kitasatospora sp. MAA4 TaxID=3035093 RepID=UPI00247662BB|nr:TIR-like protein FxsC [Kitasatospora sp. MAA4]MDH6137505.1 FxsC-like protein [Kitasatospora sp. MAA4]